MLWGRTHLHGLEDAAEHEPAACPKHRDECMHTHCIDPYLRFQPLAIYIYMHTLSSLGPKRPAWQQDITATLHILIMLPCSAVVASLHRLPIHELNQDLSSGRTTAMNIRVYTHAVYMCIPLYTHTCYVHIYIHVYPIPKVKRNHIECM